MAVKNDQRVKWLWPLLTAALLVGCASTPPPGEPHDPLEGFNRNVYAFNETVDTYALAPASRGWTRVTTDGMRQGVHNFFDNLQAPGYILNDILQGKPAGAGVQTTRFVMNSTVGLLGFFDPAEAWLGLEPRSEDFGQTLGVWGVDAGPYLVLPLLGPSSTRDATRYPVAYYTNVLTYVVLDTATLGSLTAVNVVNARTRAESAIRARDEAAVDPYVFTRSAYRQFRRNQVYDGEPPLEDDPYSDFFDEWDEEMAP